MNLYAVSIYDISDIVRYEAEISRQQRKLIVSDRLASIGMFSSSVVHEISNPNYILQLNTQSLRMLLEQQGHQNSQQILELVSQIEEASRRIEGVVGMVKSYGRKGRNEQWQTTKPREVAERAVRFTRIMASQLTSDFRLVAAEEVPSIWAEPALLEQALVNLIKNACHALPDKSGKVEVRLYEKAGEIVFDVCDTGVGFPAELVQRIGEPFSSNRQDVGGTGLGLSIVTEIARRHGGHLEIDTAEGFATCVRLAIKL